MADQVATKPVYLSKTLWVNFAMGLLALVAPPVKTAIEAHPELVVAAVSVINMILRMVTKTGVQLG